MVQQQTEYETLEEFLEARREADRETAIHVEGEGRSSGTWARARRIARLVAGDDLAVIDVDAEDLESELKDLDEGVFLVDAKSHWSLVGRDAYRKIVKAIGKNRFESCSFVVHCPDLKSDLERLLEVFVDEEGAAYRIKFSPMEGEIYHQRFKTIEVN